MHTSGLLVHLPQPLGVQPAPGEPSEKAKRIMPKIFLRKEKSRVYLGQTRLTKEDLRTSFSSLVKEFVKIIKIAMIAAINILN